MTALSKHHQRCARRGGRASPVAAAAVAAAATPGRSAPCPHHSRAVIVHPRFEHTLGDPPVAADPPPAADWAALPAEVVEHVAGFLDQAQDLLSLAATCRDARPLARRDALWRALCCRRFGVPPEQPPAEPDFWRRLYQCNHQLFRDIVRSGGGGRGRGGGLGGPRFGRWGQALVINLA